MEETQEIKDGTEWEEDLKRLKELAPNLFQEPEQGNILVTIGVIAAAVLSLINLIVLFVK